MEWVPAAGTGSDQEGQGDVDLKRRPSIAFLHPLQQALPSLRKTASALNWPHQLASST